MKKILFTLLLFTGYLHAQTYPVNPTKFGKISLNTNGVSTSTTKINTQEADGQINYIDAVNLPVPTTVTNALELKTTVSAGAVSGFALTNNGNGTVNIASGIAYLRLTNDPYSSIVKYPISAVTNLALTDNANNFILVDYNAGSPTITVTTNGSIINTQTNSLAYVISRVGNTLDYLNLVGQNIDPNAKLRVRFLNQEGIRRASGAILGFSNRNLTLTSSVLFSGLIRLDAPAFNTLTPDTFTLAYNNGATWTRTTAQTQVNNTQYNVSGVLTTMPNNDYRTDYVYLLPNNPSKLYVIMGATTYNSLTLAKGAPRPSSLPVELQVLGVEVGRLFIQKNSTTIAEVQSSFANDFIGASVPEHNSLSGLQGGISGEYNHLNNAQVSLVDGSEQISNKATDFTTVNNTLYPTVQAAKTYADGLVVGLLNDRGSYDASTNLYPSTGGSGTAGAIKKGNLWAISVAGTLGGVAVGVGDWVRALVDTPAQTAANWAVVEGNFGYVPENVANKSNSYTVSSTTTYPNTKALVDGLATKQNALTNPVTGTGTTNTIPKFTGAGTIGNSNLSDNGATVISSTDMSINGHKIGRGAGNFSDNFVMGNSAFENNTNGNFSVVIGSAAANSYNNNTTSNANLLSIGFASSRYNTTGRQFVALGNNAGALSASGSNATNLDNSIFIGFDARPLNTTTQQELVIGFQGRGLGSNTTSIGNMSSTFGRWWGNFLVGTSTNNGNIGRFAGTVDVNKLQLNTTPATASGTPPLLTWNSTTKDVESVPYATFASVTNLALGTTTTTTQPITNSNGTGFTLPSATTSLAGLQSAADKVKLDYLVTNATTVPVSKGLISGDSTIAAYLGQNSIASYLITPSDILQGNSITDISVPGNTIAQQKTAWLALSDKNTYDYIIVQIGLNDIGYTETNTAVIARLQDYINSINLGKKPSCKVFISCMNPAKQRWINSFGYTNGNIAQSQWMSVNLAIMGYSDAITGVDFRVNDHLNIIGDVLGNLASVYDTGDGIHETNDARVAIASVYRKILNVNGFLKTEANADLTRYDLNGIRSRGTISLPNNLAGIGFNAYSIGGVPTFYDNGYSNVINSTELGEVIINTSQNNTTGRGTVIVHEDTFKVKHGGIDVIGYSNATNGNESTLINNQRNNIWRFNDVNTVGVSYFSGTSGIGGSDTVGFHFGNPTASGSKFRLVDQPSSFRIEVDGNIIASSYTGGATLTDVPTAPTATAGTNTTQIATTAFVLANSGGTSGTFIPTTQDSFTYSKSYWIKIGNIVEVTINGQISGLSTYSSTITLPNSFTINTPINDRVIGTSGVMQIGTSSIFPINISENTTNNIVNIKAVPGSTTTFYFSIKFSVEVN